MNKLSIAIAASLVLAACASSTPAPITQAPQASSSSANTAQTGALSQAEIDARALAAQNLADQAAQTKGLHSVYFDYGTVDIKPEYSALIQQQADFMKSHPKDTVTLEGNTDERGSNEFNLALGESRAGAVRKVLQVLGIPDSRIKTVSFGEEKPRLTCHDESCWKENRRVDFTHKLAN